MRGTQQHAALIVCIVASVPMVDGFVWDTPLCHTSQATAQTALSGYQTGFSRHPWYRLFRTIANLIAITTMNMYASQGWVHVEAIRASPGNYTFMLF